MLQTHKLMFLFQFSPFASLFGWQLHLCGFHDRDRSTIVTVAPRFQRHLHLCGFHDRNNSNNNNDDNKTTTMTTKQQQRQQQNKTPRTAILAIAMIAPIAPISPTPSATPDRANAKSKHKCDSMEHVLVSVKNNVISGTGSTSTFRCASGRGDCKRRHGFCQGFQFLPLSLAC